MRTRWILATSLVVGLLATPAFAATAPHGRGPSAQAAMIARTAGSSKQPVQVLNQLCDNPNSQHGCAPITWVGHRRRHAGQFWVLGPVRFDRSPVGTMVSWRDPGRYGCYGWTRLSWERHRGAWSPFQGTAVEGCSAAPAPRTARRA